MFFFHPKKSRFSFSPLFVKIGGIFLALLFFFFIAGGAFLYYSLGDLRFLASHSLSMAGFGEKKTYLVLLHNDGELRATLGFISGFAVVTMSNGKPYIAFYDSYDVAPPREMIPAPAPMEHIFAKDEKYQGWVFRDTNFSPSFQENAALAVRFLQYDERFKNIAFDGIVGIDTHAIGAILDGVGGIPFQGKTLTAENFFETLEFSSKNFDHHDEVEWEQRKSPLKSIAENLISAVIKTPSQWGNIAASVVHEADTKHILFSWTEKELHQIFADRQWTGEMTADQAKAFWGINSVNIGGRKGDRYITKNFASSLFIDASGGITETFRISFTHEGTRTLNSDEYFADMRIFRPKGAVLTNAKGDFFEKKLPKAEEPSSLPESNEYSFFFGLSPGEQKTFTLSFSYPQRLQYNTPFPLFLSPQSGSGGENWDIVLRGEGDLKFIMDGCDETKKRENIFLCHRASTTGKMLNITMISDTTPPLLESGQFQNDSTVLLYFSEKLSPHILESPISLTDKETGEAVPIKSVMIDGKSVTIHLSSPVDISVKKFYTLRIPELRDLFGNEPVKVPFETTLATKKTDEPL
ncbi:MAG: DUF4012 domain-containing protein [Candidatus Peregrinibacteria bacterium]